MTEVYKKEKKKLLDCLQHVTHMVPKLKMDNRRPKIGLQQSTYTRDPEAFTCIPL